MQVGGQYRPEDKAAFILEPEQGEPALEH